jgi:hypothetical protein
MGALEELPDDSGACSSCGKISHTKCTGCKQVCLYVYREVSEQQNKNIYKYIFIILGLLLWQGLPEKALETA